MSGSRLFIVVHRSDIRSAAAVLSRHPELQLQPTPPMGQENPWRSQAEKLTELRKRVESIQHFLGRYVDPSDENPQNGPPHDSDDDEARLQKLEKTIAQFRRKRRRLQEKFERLDTRVRDVRRLEALAVAFDEVHRIEFLHLILAAIPNEQWKRLTVALARTPAVILPLAAEENHRLIAAAADRNHAAVLQRVLQSVRFRSLDLPGEDAGTPVDMLPKLKGRLEEEKEALAVLDRQVERCSRRWTGWLAEFRQRIEDEFEVVDRISRHRCIEPFYSVEGRLAVWPSHKAAFELVREVRATLQHPYTIFIGAGNHRPGPLGAIASQPQRGRRLVGADSRLAQARRRL